jgi:hypothetical protein
VLSSENGRSIRDQKYLYIVDDLDTYTECNDKNKLREFRREFLFDVVADPDNLQNLVPAENFFQRWRDKLSGKKDYSETLQHYRQLMEQRRKARGDLPRPTIQGSCPILWWQADPAKTDTPDSSDD